MNHKIFGLIAASFALAIATPVAAQTVDPITNAQQLEEAIAESHRALEAILNGDPSLYLALFADRDDITLGNPYGPFGQGRAAVAATLVNAANKYQRGMARVERVALYGDANFDKGEVIPEDLVKKMNAGRKFGKALRTMGQLGYAAISFDFYSKPMAGKDLGEVENAAAARYYPLKPVPGTHNYASFGHLTSYAASYYTYQWSEALASDLMSRFRTAGLRDKATANDYRNMILAPGGSASMNDLAREFLGRDWSVDSYREDLKRGAGE